MRKTIAIFLLPIILVFDILSFAVFLIVCIVGTAIMGLWEYVGPFLQDEWEKAKGLANVKPPLQSDDSGVKSKR